MKQSTSDKETLKREGKFYFLVEVDEPTVEGGWGFLLQTVDAKNTSYNKAVEHMKMWAQDFADTHLTERGSVKVRRIGADAVIAEESGLPQSESRPKRTTKPLSGITLLRG